MRQLLLLLLALPAFITGGPVSNPEVSTKTGKSNNIQHQQNQYQQQHQQQHQHQHQQQHHHPSYNKANSQDPHLNQLSVYATNYDMIANNQNAGNSNDENFKASYKLPDMETNFTPIQNGNSIAPDYANHMGGPTPVLMQYLPQTISGEGGVQYLQLIPTRPLIVPISPYLGGNNAAHSIGYHQTITAPNNLEYAPRPTALLNAMPVNMPPPAPTSLVEVSVPPLPAYGVHPYGGHIQQPYKQNYRINRETKDKQQVLGPLNLSLNLNEYIPGPQAQGQSTQIRGRP